jgi:hypothetical protein
MPSPGGTSAAAEAGVNVSASIGVTVGMVSMFLMVMLKILRYQPFYENDRWLICGGLAVLGLVLVIAGSFLSRRPRPKLEEGEQASSPFILANVAYWGFLFLLFGGAVTFVSPKARIARAAEARPTNSIAKPIVAMDPKFSIVEKDPAHAATAATAATNQLAALKLQGIVYDKVKPSAIINGRTYFVGDGLRDAKVVAIEPSEVVVELNGQKRTLRLGE